MVNEWDQIINGERPDTTDANKDTSSEKNTDQEQEEVMQQPQDFLRNSDDVVEGTLHSVTRIQSSQSCLAAPLKRPKLEISKEATNSEKKRDHNFTNSRTSKRNKHVSFELKDVDMNDPMEEDTDSAHPKGQGPKAKKLKNVKIKQKCWIDRGCGRTRHYATPKCHDNCDSTYYQTRQRYTTLTDTGFFNDEARGEAIKIAREYLLYYMDEFKDDKQPRNVHTWKVIMNEEPEEVVHMQATYQISNEELAIMRRPRQRPGNETNETGNSNQITRTSSNQNEQRVTDIGDGGTGGQNPSAQNNDEQPPPPPKATSNEQVSECPYCGNPIQGTTSKAQWTTTHMPTTTVPSTLCCRETCAKLHCLQYVMTNIGKLREYIHERDPMREIEALREEVREWRRQDLREMEEALDAPMVTEISRALTEQSSGDTGASSSDVPLNIMESMNGNQFLQMVNVRIRRHGQSHVDAEETVLDTIFDGLENAEREEESIIQLESWLNESAEMRQRDGQPRDAKQPPPNAPYLATVKAHYLMAIQEGAVPKAKTQAMISKSAPIYMDNTATVKAHVAAKTGSQVKSPPPPKAKMEGAPLQTAHPKASSSSIQAKEPNIVDRAKAATQQSSAELSIRQMMERGETIRKVHCPRCTTTWPIVRRWTDESQNVWFEYTEENATFACSAANLGCRLCGALMRNGEWNEQSQSTENLLGMQTVFLTSTGYTTWIHTLARVQQKKWNHENHRWEEVPDPSNAIGPKAVTPPAQSPPAKAAQSATAPVSQRLLNLRPFGLKQTVLENMSPFERQSALHEDNHIKGMRAISPQNEANYEWRTHPKSQTIIEIMANAVRQLPWPAINATSRATSLATSLPNGHRITMTGLSLNDLKSLSESEQEMRQEAAQRVYNNIGRIPTGETSFDMTEFANQMIRHVENMITDAQDMGLIGIHDARETRVFWTPTPQSRDPPAIETRTPGTSSSNRASTEDRTHNERNMFQEGIYSRPRITVNGDDWRATWKEGERLCQICGRPFEVMVIMDPLDDDVLQSAQCCSPQCAMWHAKLIQPQGNPYPDEINIRNHMLFVDQTMPNDGVTPFAVDSEEWNKAIKDLAINIQLFLDLKGYFEWNTPGAGDKFPDEPKRRWNGDISRKEKKQNPTSTDDKRKTTSKTNTV